MKLVEELQMMGERKWTIGRVWSIIGSHATTGR